MSLRRPSVVLLLAGLLAGCGGGSASPTSPTPPASITPTRLVDVTGTLAFGEVAVGASRDIAITIANSGTAAVTIRSAPTAEGDFSGTVTVNGDQTSGTSTIAISGSALSALVASLSNVTRR